MTPAFGFSVGDFINTINLIRKITKALKDTGGASSQYQDAVVELEGLKHILQHLEALKPTEDNLGHVNAIRGMALACKIHLQEFMTKLETYEESLGPWAQRSSLNNFGRKTKWAVSFGKEVERLRAIVAAKQISINLLLATHCSQTLSSMHNRMKGEYDASKARDEEHKIGRREVQSAIQGLQDRVNNTASAAQASMQTLSDKIDVSNAAVFNLRTIADHILTFVKTFPQEIRDRLQALTQADWRTYQAVLQIQEQISHHPGSLHDSNIQFTNALGEFRSLPYEYFCHWEIFEGFLRTQFKNKPGESKVLNGSFHIIDMSQRAIVNQNHWNRRIEKGACLTMSMIMQHLRRRISGQCPQPNCTGIGFMCSKNPDQMTCDTCSLTFFQEMNDLEDAFDRVAVSEDFVTRQQLEEDVQLYGARPEPADVVTVSANVQSATPTSKRDFSQLNDTTDRVAKVRKINEGEGPEPPVLAAMDWNSGTSPLEAWLNQSAVPSVVTAKRDLEQADESMVAQEMEEIKSFRNVHVMTAPDSTYRSANLHIDEEFASLRAAAQIYYRNIKDRFPHIPAYLAHRLAEANLDRAEALHKRKNARIQREQQAHRDEPILPAHNFQVLRRASTTSEKAQKNTTSTAKNGKKQSNPNLVYLDGEEQFLWKLREEENLSWRDISVRFQIDFGKSYQIPALQIRFRRLQSRMSRWNQTDFRANEQGHDYWEQCPSETAKRVISRKEEFEHFWNTSQWQNSEPKFLSEETLDFYISKEWLGQNYEPKYDKTNSIPVLYDEPSEPKGFWNGGPPSRRPSSIASMHSRSSSMNSPLRGSPRLDPCEQDDNVPQFPPSSPRGLPPPPVDLKMQRTFDCDICGELVQVERRRQWQEHVMSDLRPYSCTVEECTQSARTYTSRKQLVKHEREAHFGLFYRSISMCLFCPERISSVCTRNRARHIGRHMEEIAFAVVPKAYEDWEFYSDSSEGQTKDTIPILSRMPSPFGNTSTSSKHPTNQSGPYKCGKINPSTGKPCNTLFSRAYDLTRHEDTIHNSRKEKIRCEYCVEEKMFSRRDALTRHMRVVHPNEDFPGKTRSGNRKQYTEETTA